MSDAAHSDHESHEGPIRTPKQLIVTVVASFVLPVVIIILLINFVAWDTQAGRRQRRPVGAKPWRVASRRWACRSSRIPATSSR